MSDNYQQQSQPRGVTHFPIEHARRLHKEVAGSAILEADIKRRLEVARELATVVGEQINGAPPEGYEVNFVVIPVDRVADVYPVVKKGRDVPPFDNDPVAVSGNLLHALAAQLGQISWSIKRVDDGRTKHVWEAQATATITFSSGSVSTFQDIYRLDLRDGEQDALAAGNGLGAKRGNAHKLVCTGAQNRCLRKALGIRGGLRRDEVRPFVITRLVWTGRASRPEYQAMVAQQGTVRMMLNQAAAFGAHGGLIVGQAFNGLLGGGNQAPAPQLAPGVMTVGPAVVTQTEPAGAYNPNDDPDLPQDNEPPSAPRQQAPAAPSSSESSNGGGNARRTPTTCPWDDSAAAKRNVPPRFKKGDRLATMSDEGLAALSSALEWKAQHEQEPRWRDFAEDHLRVVRGIQAARESSLSS